jgi:hypothetical protein
MGFLTIFKKKEQQAKIEKDLVLFTQTDVQQSTFSEFYSLEICPECHRVLDHEKARYRSKCCYKCGYTNGSLFYCQTVIVRDRYVNGKFIETLVHDTADDDE